MRGWFWARIVPVSGGFGTVDGGFGTVDGLLAGRILQCLEGFAGETAFGVLLFQWVGDLGR